MKWTNADSTKMIDLSSVNSYEYISREECEKDMSDNQTIRKFFEPTSYLKLYVNGAIIELEGTEADSVYALLNKTVI
jgi:hypothetical protein